MASVVQLTSPSLSLDGSQPPIQLNEVWHALGYPTKKLIYLITARQYVRLSSTIYTVRISLKQWYHELIMLDTG